MAQKRLKILFYLSIRSCTLVAALSPEPALNHELEQCRDPSTRLRLEHLGSCPLAITDKTRWDSQTWSPWTHQPYCADTDYCVYTNALFQGGVSFIATPERAAVSLATLGPLQGGVSLENSLTNTSILFEVKDVPGKGKGLVATRRIAKGEVLMVDYPRFIADTHFPIRTKRQNGQKLLQRAADQLAEPKHVMALARSSTNGSHPVEDIMRTNSFTVTIDNKVFMGMFPRIARINHACNPNALTRFSEKALSSTVLAFRNIDQNEEITLSYTDFGLTHDERQTRLRQNWGFTCTCSLCTASDREIVTSDKRRRRIREVRERVLEEVQKKQFKAAIKLNHELLQLVTDERLIPHRGEHYHVMARLYLAAQDRTNAKKYAEMGLVDLEAYGGPDTLATIEELRDILRVL